MPRHAHVGLEIDDALGEGTGELVGDAQLLLHLRIAVHLVVLRAHGHSVVPLTGPTAGRPTGASAPRAAS